MTVHSEMAQRRQHKLPSFSEQQPPCPPSPGITATETNTDQKKLPSLQANMSMMWNVVTQFLAVAVAVLFMMWQTAKALMSKWCSISCQGLLHMKRNPSVNGEVDVLVYSKKWKGEELHVRQMRKGYEQIYNKHHIKYLRPVKDDNYSPFRATLFQVFNQGIPFPGWMKEKDILKLPEKLLYSQGCNWIQQFSFGPEKYAGPKVYGKLRKCLEVFRRQWMEISSCKDQSERQNMCKTIFSDEATENKLYEAVKFIMLYLVIEAYENMKLEQDIPSFYTYLFSRESSADPLSFMMNHLNSVGDTTGLEQIELFLLGYSLEVRIKVFRLSKVNTENFEILYPDSCKWDWHEICLVTEDDRHYNIPVTSK
ncbi:inactive ubiquitin thioesterase OTULINL isoform X1 [Pelobates cultripes]|uniref:Inactive ubiquitin thioesterase OTULINL isoform X1 n=2 Tax=Pelobates cultripes TaxID=61616 RepID=A0AAD1W4M6_PELCU|nr:inactive ubiquitin thioesterase OTULINL isoform X1 [Pelobates cultripes]